MSPGTAVALVRTKADLEYNKPPYVSEAEVLEFVAKSGILFHIKTSAKTGENVRELFERLSYQ